jgi:hypothetical protein
MGTAADLLADIPDVARVERLSLRPGDRLVLTVARSLDDAEFCALREQVGALGFPEGSVLILDSGMSLQVLEAAT